MTRILFIAITVLLLAACEQTTPITTGSGAAPVPTLTLPPTESAVWFDSQGYADTYNIPVEEAVRRLQIQEESVQLQERLRADFPDTFSTLWLEHEPEFRIVLGYTGGEASQFDPLLAELPYAAYVEPRLMTLSEAELSNIQAETLTTLMENDINVASSWTDVITQRVFITAGNPDLMREQVAAAGIELHEAVVLQATNPDYIPPSNKGYVIEETTSSGEPVILIAAAPADAYMAALIEGILTLDENSCFRIESDFGDVAPVVVWPNGSELNITDEAVEVVYHDGTVLGRVGEHVSMGGGEVSTDHLLQSIPSYPAEACPGHAWIASP